MHLGKLTYPDGAKLHDPRKLTSRRSIQIHTDSFQFFLPGHKADRFFEGNTILLRRNALPCNPMSFFTRYLASRDHRFPLSLPLWLQQNGSVSTRSFFMT